MAPQKTCIIGRWVASLLTTLYYQDNILIINRITVQILYCTVLLYFHPHHNLQTKQINLHCSYSD